MELAKSLVENLDFGDVDRVWESSRLKDAKPLRPFHESEDENIGAGLVPRIRAEVWEGSYEQRLLFVP